MAVRIRFSIAPSRQEEFYTHNSHDIPTYSRRAASNDGLRRTHSLNYSTGAGLYSSTVPYPRSFSSHSSNQPNWSWHYAYRLKYPLPSYSLRLYRDVTATRVGPGWVPPGRYVPRGPTPLSPEKRPQPIIKEPVWHPPGQYKHKRPASLSPERRPQPIIKEPVWHSSSQYKHKRPASLSPEKRPQPIIKEPAWNPPGQYKHKRLTRLSPEKRPQPIIKEPVWRSPGQYKHERPKSLSPERRPQPKTQEPVWRPNGRIERKPTPYFDPPGLRWSIRDLTRSMPHLQSRYLRESRKLSSDI